MQPDLVSFAGGGNDVLRRSFDPPTLVARFDEVVGELRAAGADVMLFRFADVTAAAARPAADRGPASTSLNQRRRRRSPSEHGALLVDLWADDEFANPLLWSIDRLHLSPAGHRRVAAHVLTALGVGLRRGRGWPLRRRRRAASWLRGPRRRSALGRPAPGALGQAAAHRPVLRGHGAPPSGPQLAPVDPTLRHRSAGR